MTFLRILATTALLTGSALVHGQDAAAPSRTELRDRQLDVALEARDIERILAKLKRASDLSKERITEAATVSESVSTSLDRGDSQAAKKDAEQAAAMFREIAKQLEALLAEDTPQRVAAARNLASQLSRTERQFAQQLKGALNPPQATGMGKVDPNSQVKPLSGAKGQGGGEKKPEDDQPRDGQGGGKPEDTAKPENKPAGTGQDPTSADKDKEGTAGKEKPMPGDKDQQGAGDGQKPMPDDNKDGSGAGEKPTEPKSPMGNGPGKDEDAKPEQPAGKGGGNRRPMTDEERREALAARAAELAEKGETLLDILKAIAASTEPGDADAVAKVDALLKETKLAEAVAAMKQAAEQVADKQLDDARLSALDIADRMEIAAQRLDAAYRTIVAPQAEELRKLEQQLALVGARLEDLQTQAQVAAWHREVRELLDRADALGVSETVREALLEELKKGGFGAGVERDRFNWGLVNGRYVAPNGYTVKLLELQEEVQARIQGLLLGDVVSAADEATPPKYEGLVERYYQVLSRTGRDPSANAFRNPPTKPTPMPKEKP